MDEKGDFFEKWEYFRMRIFPKIFNQIADQMNIVKKNKNKLPVREVGVLIQWGGISVNAINCGLDVNVSG